MAATLVVAPPSQAAAGDELINLSELLPDPAIIHPDLAAGVSVDPSTIGPVADKLVAARADLVEASSREAVAAARLGSLGVAERLTTAELKLLRSKEGMASAFARESNEELGAFAVGAFVEGETDQFEELRMRGTVDPRVSLTGDVGELLRAISDDAAAALADVAGRRGQLDVDLQRLVADQTAVSGERATAESDRADAAERIAQYGPAFERALMTARVNGLDFPMVVLDAYYRAERTMADDRPGCRVLWYQLAAIGRVESGHGTFRGSTVGADGTTSDRILGPVLDGTLFASIPDTDGGLHDGDTLWDRAVGPMQFIPSSWKLFGRDGNGDDFADPHNLYDAALAAAEHLCRSNSGLDRPERYRTALLGYNRSVAYGQMVMGYAEDYRSAIDLGPSPDSLRALTRGSNQ